MKYENNVRKAKIIKVVNGNTIDLEIDLGLGICLTKRCDLARISPKDQFDRDAADLMTVIFGIVKDVTIQFDRHPDEAARTLVELWDDVGRNINDWLLRENIAELDERLFLRVIT